MSNGCPCGLAWLRDVTDQVLPSTATRLDTRVKCRMHPGRVQYTTPIADEGSGAAPMWNDAFEVACPRGDRPDVDYTPTLSFRCCLLPAACCLLSAVCRVPSLHGCRVP